MPDATLAAISGLVPALDSKAALSAPQTFTGLQSFRPTVAGGPQQHLLDSTGALVAQVRARAGANLGIGTAALLGLTSGAANNVGLGESAGVALTDAVYNTAIGVGALLSETTGDNNVGVGGLSLNSQVGVSGSVGAGYAALYSNVNGTNVVGVGLQALFLSTASNQAVLGSLAASAVTTGGDTTALGALSLAYPAGLFANATTTGAAQTAVGSQTGQASTTPVSNTVAVGYRALFGASGATALGALSQALHTGSVALGSATTTTAANQVMVGGRDIEITDTAKGLVGKSPDGTRYRIQFANGGALSGVAA